MAPSAVTWQSSWHLARRHRSWRRARKYPLPPFLSARFFSVLSAQNTTAAVPDRTARSLRRRPGSPPVARPAPCLPPPRQLISPPTDFANGFRRHRTGSRARPPGVRRRTGSRARPPGVRRRRPELAAPARRSSRRPELRQRSATARYGWPPPVIFLIY
jgi:hypothetical protein